MAYYNNFDDLIAAAESKIESILDREVKKEVENIVLNHIKLDIYDAYSPSIYKRRGSSGGLLDRSNIYSEIHGDTLVVTSVASPSPPIWSNVHAAPVDPAGSMLLQWIEYDRVPNYFNSKVYPWQRGQGGRMAIYKAQLEINRQGAKGGGLYNAINAGIAREF